MEKTTTSQDSWGGTTVEGSKGVVGFKAANNYAKTRSPIVILRSFSPYAGSVVFAPQKKIKAGPSQVTGFPGATHSFPAEAGTPR